MLSLALVKIMSYTVCEMQKTKEKPGSIKVEADPGLKSGDVDLKKSGEEVVTNSKKEFGGAKGLEPTRYGDWESKGRCYDF